MAKMVRWSAGNGRRGHRLDGLPGPDTGGAGLPPPVGEQTSRLTRAQPGILGERGQAVYAGERATCRGTAGLSFDRQQRPCHSVRDGV
jgi:hypothetical protein